MFQIFLEDIVEEVVNGLRNLRQKDGALIVLCYHDGNKTNGLKQYGLTIFFLNQNVEVIRE